MNRGGEREEREEEVYNNRLCGKFVLSWTHLDSAPALFSVNLFFFSSPSFLSDFLIL